MSKFKTLIKQVVVNRVPAMVSLVFGGFIILGTMVSGSVSWDMFFGVPNFLITASRSSADGHAIYASPNPVLVCGESGSTTLSWTVPVTGSYEIRKGSKDGQLVIATEDSGTVMVSGISTPTVYYLVAKQSTAQYQWRYTRQGWRRVLVTQENRTIVSEVSVEVISQCPGGENNTVQNKLGIDIMPDRVSPGQSYVVAAHFFDAQGTRRNYSGFLDYDLNFCSNGVCQRSSGAWGAYQVVNGFVTIDLPSTTPEGEYIVRFRPRNENTWILSDPDTILVTSANVVAPPPPSQGTGTITGLPASVLICPTDVYPIDITVRATVPYTLTYGGTTVPSRSFNFPANQTQTLSTSILLGGNNSVSFNAALYDQRYGTLLASAHMTASRRDNCNGNNGDSGAFPGVIDVPSQTSIGAPVRVTARNNSSQLNMSFAADGGTYAVGPGQSLPVVSYFSRCGQSLTYTLSVIYADGRVGSSISSTVNAPSCP